MSIDPTPTPSPIPPLPPLPNWLSGQSVTMFLVALFGLLIAIAGVFHIGVPDQTIVNALLPTAGALIALVAGWINVHYHHLAVVAYQNAVIALHQSLGYSPFGLLQQSSFIPTDTIEQADLGVGGILQAIEQGFTEMRTLLAEVLSFLKGIPK